MAVRSDRVRVSLTLSTEMGSRLDSEASGAGVTKSALVEGVLAGHLSAFAAAVRPSGGDAQKVRLTFSGESRDARTARLQREGREAQARRDALIGSGR